MADTTEFTIGAEVSCGDEECGKLSWLVVDPIAKAVTHLVVEPRAFLDISRLVPLDRVESATPEHVRLGCTEQEFRHFDPAEETQFLPGTPLSSDLGPGPVVTWPYYGLAGGPGMNMGLAGEDLIAPVTYDKVPLGEVEVRRGDHVHATDGEIGRVEGLVVDAADRHVTHVLLQEGHLWGRKDVAIPISSIAKVDEEGIKLKLSKHQVKDLAPVNIADFAD